MFETLNETEAEELFGKIGNAVHRSVFHVTTRHGILYWMLHWRKLTKRTDLNAELCALHTELFNLLMLQYEGE